MWNNKGFILYDALISFIVLSTTFMFFNQMILINSKNTIDTNIEIEGFKSIKRLVLKLSPINILIGSNGVGKSNFLSFFKLVNNIYEQRLQHYSLKSGIDNLLHYGRKNTSEIKGYLDFGNNAYRFNILPTDEGSMFIDREDSLLNYQTQ